MQNFNTNQTRHLYVAGAINANVGKDRNAADNAAASNLDIALASTATGEMYFQYKNADGLVTRSDSFDPKKIVSLKNTPAADLAQPLMMASVSADTNVIDFSGTSSYIGKAFNLKITIHGVFDYDDDNSKVILASLVGDATNLASQAAFTKALAITAAKNLVNKVDPSYPLLQVFYHGTEVTKDSKVANLSGSYTTFELVQGPQKWVRGKLTGEPVNFSVSSSVDDVVNGVTYGQKSFLTETSSDIVPSNVTGHLAISGDYKLADLEYFALGERGDMIRGFNFPDNYDTKYSIVPGTSYSVLSIEYYWAGSAENVQKSPRLIQVAAPYNSTASSDICTLLYDDIDAARNGVASS